MNWYTTLTEVSETLEGTVTLRECLSYACWSYRINQGTKFNDENMHLMWKEIAHSHLRKKLIEEICLRGLRG